VIAKFNAAVVDTLIDPKSRSRFAELAQQLSRANSRQEALGAFPKDRDREVVADHQSGGHYSQLVQRGLRASFSLTRRNLLATHGRTIHRVKLRKPLGKHICFALFYPMSDIADYNHRTRSKIIDKCPVIRRMTGYGMGEEVRLSNHREILGQTRQFACDDVQQRMQFASRASSACDASLNFLPTSVPLRTSRGHMRTAGALRLAVHPAGPKRARRSAACSTCTGTEPKQLSLKDGGEDAGQQAGRDEHQRQ
jgi:hypothetical protein